MSTTYAIAAPAMTPPHELRSLGFSQELLAISCAAGFRLRAGFLLPFA